MVTHHWVKWWALEDSEHQLQFWPQNSSQVYQWFYSPEACFPVFLSELIFLLHVCSILWCLSLFILLINHFTRLYLQSNKNTHSLVPRSQTLQLHETRSAQWNATDISLFHLVHLLHAYTHIYTRQNTAGLPVHGRSRTLVTAVALHQSGQNADLCKKRMYTYNQSQTVHWDHQTAPCTATHYCVKWRKQH